MIKVAILGENGSVHVQKWIKAIHEFGGIELHVISFNRGAKFEGVTYHYINLILNNKLDYLLNLWRVKRLLKKINPDLIHAHYATSYGLLAAFSGYHPMLITGWGADIFDSPNNFFMKRILQYSFNKADAITVLSKITKKEMLKLTPKHVELIPFGVDINKFKKIESTKDNIIRIGTIRTLAEKYGIEYLIRGFDIVCKKHVHVRLEIVGDGPLKAQLVALTQELNIADKVTFHGFINQNTEFERYMQLMSSFDIFAILSILDSETFGVAAVEASSCSLPVVATHVGGLPEVVENGVTGILVAPKDALATAAALDKLISNESLRKEMGKQGRIKVEQEYFWQNNVEKMVNLYKQLTHKN